MSVPGIVPKRLSPQTIAAERFTLGDAILVVNGDAELVAWFNYRTSGDHTAVEIELEGAIDIPSVQKKITVVMESGEKR
jgi:chromosome segregation protein